MSRKPKSIDAALSVLARNKGKRRDLNVEADDDICVEFQETSLGRTLKMPPQCETNHPAEWLPRTHIIGIFVGRSGCGKSSAVVSTICGMEMKSLFKVIICTLIRNNIAYRMLGKHLRANNVKFAECNSIEDEDDDENPRKGARTTIEEAITERNHRDPNKRVLIVYDDFSEHAANKSSGPYALLQKQSFTMLRNLKCDMLFCTQDYGSIPVICRNNANLACLWGCQSQFGVRNLIRDVSQAFNIPEYALEYLYRRIAPSDHDFLLISGKRIFISSDNKLQQVEITQTEDGE